MSPQGHWEVICFNCVRVGVSIFAFNSPADEKKEEEWTAEDFETEGYRIFGKKLVWLVLVPMLFCFSLFCNSEPSVLGWERSTLGFVFLYMLFKVSLLHVSSLLKVLKLFHVFVSGVYIRVFGHFFPESEDYPDEQILKKAESLRFLAACVSTKLLSEDPNMHFRYFSIMIQLLYLETELRNHYSIRQI